MLTSKELKSHFLNQN